MNQDDDPGITTTELQSSLERLALLGNQLGTQQEKRDFLIRLKELEDHFSADNLEETLPPKNVVASKGRPKNTRREKTGLEHEDCKITQEIKEEKKRKRNEKKEDIKTKQRKRNEKKAQISKKDANLINQK